MGGDQVRTNGHTLRRGATKGFTRQAWNIQSLDGDWVKLKPSIRYDSTYAARSGTADFLCVCQGVLIAAINGKIYRSNVEIGTYTGSVHITQVGDLIVWSDTLVSGTYLQCYNVTTARVGTLGNAEPSVGSVVVSALGSGGSLSAGDYYYRLVWVDENGFRSAPSDYLGPVTCVANDTVRLTPMPSKPSTKYSHLEIYRTTVSGASSGYGSVCYYVGTVAAGGTYNDTSADSSLGDPVPMLPSYPSSYRTMPTGIMPTRWGDRLAWSDDNRVYWSAVDSDGFPKWGETHLYRVVGDDDPIVALAVHDKQLFIFKRNEMYVLANTSPYACYKLHDVGTAHRGTVAVSDRIYFWFRSKLYAYGTDGLAEVSQEVSPIGSEIDAGVFSPTSLFVDDRGNVWMCGQADSITDFDYQLSGSFPYPHVAYVYNPSDGAWYRFMNCDYTYGAFNDATNTMYVINEKGRIQTFDWKLTGDQVSSSDALYVVRGAGWTYVAANRITLSVPSADYLIGTWVWFWNASTQHLGLSRVSALPSATDIQVEGNLFADVANSIVIIGHSYMQWDFDIENPNFKDTKLEKFAAWLRGYANCYVSTSITLTDVSLTACSADMRTASSHASYLFLKEVPTVLLGGTFYIQGFMLGNPRFDRYAFEGQPGGRR